MECIGMLLEDSLHEPRLYLCLQSYLLPTTLLSVFKPCKRTFFREINYLTPLKDSKISFWIRLKVS